MNFRSGLFVSATFAWVAGAIFGALIVLAQIYILMFRENVYISIDLTGYLMYIATPLTGGILGYMGKTAFENREKIIRSFKFKKDDDTKS